MHIQAMHVHTCTYTLFYRDCLTRSNLLFEHDVELIRSGAVGILDNFCVIFKWLWLCWDVEIRLWWTYTERFLLDWNGMEKIIFHSKFMYPWITQLCYKIKFVFVEMKSLKMIASLCWWIEKKCWIMSSLRSLVAFKQVVRAKKSGESVITNPKVARSLGERQLRNRLHGCPAFFVSPVRWRMGHWIRKLTCQSKCPKGHLQGTTLITMQIFGT